MELKLTLLPPDQNVLLLQQTIHPCQHHLEWPEQLPEKYSDSKFSTLKEIRIELQEVLSKFRNKEKKVKCAIQKENMGTA